MAKFLTELDAKLIDDDGIWELDAPLVYESDLLYCTVTVPKGFQTDFASVPRIPVVYMFFGDKAHRESVLHDYLYRIDSSPTVSYNKANGVFYEAMKLRGKSIFVRYPMWWGVCGFGFSSYHKKKVGDKLWKNGG